MKSIQQRDYDIVIIGGGLAGWLLLEALARESKFSSLKILLLTEGDSSPRSWCFWDNHLREPFASMVACSWSTLSFRSDGFVTNQKMEELQYHYIPGKAFFKYFLEDFLPKHPNIHYKIDKVQKISGNPENFQITTNSNSYTSHQVYNSAFLDKKPSIEIWQHFRGWFIETATPLFNPKEAVLMDFSTSQDEGCNFMYILPLSETRALVELTYFSPQVLDATVYERKISYYIQERFGDDYKIIEEEYGQIPMQQGVFSHNGPCGEINIGTLGGMVKASTGYAFQRIRADSQILAKAYYEGQNPKRVSENSRFGFYDALLLWIIQFHPEDCKLIFTQLFQRRKIEQNLKFMGQETNLWEEVNIFLRLPISIFLKALLYWIFKPISQGKTAIRVQSKMAKNG